MWSYGDPAVWLMNCTEAMHIFAKHVLCHILRRLLGMFLMKDLQLRVHQTVASLSVQLVPRCHDSTVHGKIHDFCCKSQEAWLGFKLF